MDNVMSPSRPVLLIPMTTSFQVFQCCPALDVLFLDVTVIIFKQFSNRPAWNLHLEAPRRKTAPLGDRRGCSVPSGGFTSWTSASRRCGRFLQSLHADEHLQRGPSVQMAPWPRATCVAAATGGSSVNERAGGFYTGKALIAPTHFSSFSFFLFFKIFF